MPKTTRLAALRLFLGAALSLISLAARADIPPPQTPPQPPGEAPSQTSCLAPAPGRLVDIGLAPGAGFFTYPQYVDGGYYVNDRPYDLIWRGPELQLSADFHWYFQSHPAFGIGLASGFMFAPTASASDAGGSVSVHPGKSAIGGFGALAAAIRPNERWRISFWLGYGGHGVSDGGAGFGGWGVATGIATHYMLTARALAPGIGLRLNTMILSSPSEGTVRGEWGVLTSLLAELIFDISISRGGAVPST